MYDINTKNIKRGKIKHLPPFLAGLFFLLLIIFLVIPKYINEGDKTIQDWAIVLLCGSAPCSGIIIGIIGIIKSNKRIKEIKNLNKTGKLIKNLPYYIDNYYNENDRPVYKIIVDYTLPSGTKVELVSDEMFDGKEYDDNHTVDLVIDENNPDNYFIDFEINRLTGNLETDYFDYQNNQVNQSDNNIQTNLDNNNTNNN